MAAAAFWIALAAVIIAGQWFRSRSEALKHETLRRIVERNGQIDETQFKALFQPPAPPTPEWMRRPPPGGGYRTLRVFGCLVLFLAFGLAIFFTVILQTGAERHDSAMIGFASTSVVALIGAGLFFAARFLPRPSGQDEQS